MEKILLKKSFRVKDLKIINFNSLWGYKGIFTTIRLAGKKPKLILVEEHIKKNKSFIVCFWHNRLLMAVFCWKWSKEFKMLISGHADGKIISNAISYFGIQTITGSSRKHNLSSLIEITICIDMMV